MKLILLLVSFLTFTACHNSHTTSTDPALKKMNIEFAPYLSLDHASRESVLRTRLLKMALDLELNDVKANEKWNSKLEEVIFKFNDHSFVMSPDQRADYLVYQENSAQIVVSLNNKLLIYFLPAEYPKTRAIRQLGLMDTEDSKTYWFNDQDLYLKKNKTYFVVRSSKNELKENDVFFHTEEMKIGKDFNEHYFNFDSNQIIDVKIDIVEQATATFIKIYQGKTVLCKRELKEAGLCDPCQYKLETAGGTSTKRTNDPELALIDVMINGKIFGLKELGIKLMDDGFFHFILDLKKAGAKGKVTLEFHKSVQSPKIKRVEGFDYASGCIEQGVSNTINMTPFYDVNLELKVYGRNLDF